MDLSNRQVGTSSGSCSKSASRRDAGGEIVVGFDDDARKLVEQLMGDKKKLQIISIVGMPGLGKTTLARKVYNDPMIVYRFYIRGWTYVTQVPRKRDLLIGILRSGFDYKDEDNEISDEKLSEMLKRRLSGQRYLIVMDDIWDIGAWNVLKWSFPDNENGSRIIFTSRLAEVPLRAQPEGYRHHLRFLSDEESWDLLQHKVFQGENHLKMSTGDDFMKIYIGKEITRKCHGLPLTIVLVAGILANDMTLNWWSQVAKDMSNSFVPRQYMDTLALSYNHLPPHLKPCFMYFGAFPEDYEIPVWKLILLWVAEGFIHKTGENNNLEDIAAGFLKDLIHRSLVIVAKRGSDGGIKACIVHDLLRDLCLTKAHEENFLQQFERYKKPYINSVSPLETLFWNFMPRPLCIHSPNSFRVLDLSSIVIPTFPIEIVQLEDLRFIALRTSEGSIPTSISNLQYLETLIVELQQQGVIVPKNIWKIMNLRHLVVQQLGRGLVDFEDPCFKEEESYELGNIETIKSLNSSSKFNDHVLERTPNLQKLGISGNLCPPPKYLMLPNLGKLNRLQKLKLVNTSLLERNNWEPFTFSSSVFFPATLKRLTFIGTHLVWNEMEKIGMLPNLEVLKLINMAFVGERWETSDGGFPRLKYLKLESLDIEQWHTSSEHFPNLVHLKLDGCWILEEIPLDLGDIYTLEIIEVGYGNHNVVQSAYDIKEDQETKGNDLLKILVNRTALFRVKSQYNLLDLLSKHSTMF